MKLRRVERGKHRTTTYVLVDSKDTLYDVSYDDGQYEIRAGVSALSMMSARKKYRVKMCAALYRRLDIDGKVDMG